MAIQDEDWIHFSVVWIDDIVMVNSPLTITPLQGASNFKKIFQL